MGEKALFVGLDFGNKESRLCYYDEQKYEVICVNNSAIPTILGVKDTGEWLFGNEAAEAQKAGRCELIEDGVSCICGNRPIMAGDKEVKPVFYIATYMRKLLSLLHEYEPDKGIRKLVITTYHSDRHLTDYIYIALESIGIKRNRVAFMNYRQSFLHYVMSQGREFWINDVGMFDFGYNGFRYLQMTMDRRKSPYIVGVREKDYSDTINMSMLDGGNERLEYEFDSITQSAIHKQILSTLYMIGPGFENGWADNIMKKLCSGRRVFKGEKLYADGACQAARHLEGEGNVEPFVYIDENMIASHITARIYVNAANQELIIAKAGTAWYEIDNSVDIIPDGEFEMALNITNVITRENSKHLISLKDIVAKRPDRMSRIRVRVRMQDTHNMIVTVKDNGFGEICPSSNRIYERIIKI